MTAMVMAQDGMQEAQDAVRKRLIDPGSAQFEQLRETQKLDPQGHLYPAVCGLVNARNAAGGYAGRTRFVYSLEFRRVFLADHPEVQDGFSADRYVGPPMWDRYCGP
jgi:hypothetical protein